MPGRGGASKTENRSELIPFKLKPMKPMETVDRKTAFYVSENTNVFGVPTDVRFAPESGHQRRRRERSANDPKRTLLDVAQCRFYSGRQAFRRPTETEDLWI